jgi:hypothetical protein
VQAATVVVDEDEGWERPSSHMAATDLSFSFPEMLGLGRSQLKLLVIVFGKTGALIIAVELVSIVDGRS